MRMRHGLTSRGEFAFRGRQIVRYPVQAPRLRGAAAVGGLELAPEALIAAQ